ncbi:hypothetical protein [Candidatus Methylacidithermus pantelleriae]|uniref:Uncharacterized protein n=1 Tax=Candidatus Methylacidithermus pantelleriae TaxID=2744239 RepID=A0A8J2BR75_9BACT|nr:hypothetical protein [Candidatus Methylacidithermus pantelleriae]CAF0692900.1 hypothetical protein MPNT_130004 [Candidatus Methylacidithermus pantelleriae]
MFPNGASVIVLECIVPAHEAPHLGKMLESLPNVEVFLTRVRVWPGMNRKSLHNRWEQRDGDFSTMTKLEVVSASEKVEEIVQLVRRHLGRRKKLKQEILLRFVQGVYPIGSSDEPQQRDGAGRRQLAQVE